MGAGGPQTRDELADLYDRMAEHAQRQYCRSVYPTYWQCRRGEFPITIPYTVVPLYRRFPMKNRWI